MTKDEKQIIVRTREHLLSVWDNSAMDFSLSHLIDARKELANLDAVIDLDLPVDRSLGDYHEVGAGSQ